MVWTHLTWGNVVFLRLSIKQLLDQHIPLLKLYIAAISVGACGWLHCTIIKGCHNNTHCTVSLPHLTLRTQLNTVLRTGALCPQTAITDVEYLTFHRPLTVGNMLPISAHYNSLTDCESFPCASVNGFCNNADIFKYMHYYSQLVEECFPNTTLSNGNLHGLLWSELIPDIIKKFQMHIAHIMQFSSINIKTQTLLRGKQWKSIEH